MAVAVEFVPRSRGYHHGDLREALLEAGISAVAAHGFEHLSLRAIAQGIGVSPSAAYHHFADKEALLKEIGRRVVDLLDSAVIDAAKAIHGSDSEAALARSAAAGMAYIEFAVSNPNLFRVAFCGVCANTGPDEDGAGHQYLIGLLDDLVATGALAQGARDGAEQVLWATVHGLALLIIEGHLERGDIPTYMGTMQRMMRSGQER